MGVIDRIIRVVIALVLGVLIYLKVITGILAIVLGVIGGIFILTSIIGICPLYLPFKISTKKK
jgi:hypothetical protein